MRTPRDALRIRGDALPIPEDALRVLRASLRRFDDPLRVLRASQRARSGPIGTPQGASRVRSGAVRLRSDSFTRSEALTVVSRAPVVLRPAPLEEEVRETIAVRRRRACVRTGRWARGIREGVARDGAPDAAGPDRGTDRRRIAAVGNLALSGLSIGSEHALRERRGEVLTPRRRDVPAERQPIG